MTEWSTTAVHSNTKFYPRISLLLSLSAICLLATAGLFWIWQNSYPLLEEQGMPLIGRIIGLSSSVLLGLSVIASLITVLPILQKFVRRKPSLHLDADALKLTLGLGRTHEFSWEDVARAEAHSIRGRMGLGWVTIQLRSSPRSIGRELSIPHIYLDADIEVVTKAIESRLPQQKIRQK